MTAVKEFAQLKKNLKKDFSGLPIIKVALLGDSATQLLDQALRGSAFDSGVYFEIREADFGQIEQQIMDPSSELYEFDPAIIIIFHSSHKLLLKYNKTGPHLRSLLTENRIQLIGELYSTIK